ncbi:hypothetical protein QW131_02865 [Roseibium salinum]|nr:hypothetical protein [Roseibium salinum]
MPPSMAISVDAIGMGMDAMRSAGLASETVRPSWSVKLISSALAVMDIAAASPAAAVILRWRNMAIPLCGNSYCKATLCAASGGMVIFNMTISVKYCGEKNMSFSIHIL